MSTCDLERPRAILYFPAFVQDRSVYSDGSYQIRECSLQDRWIQRLQ